MSTATCRQPGRPRSAAADRAILAATLELLAEQGFAGLSVGAVAARAGVGKATIYRRYPSREDLVAAALSHLNDDLPDVPAGRDVASTLVAMLEAVRTRSPDSLTWRIVNRVVGEADAHPELVRSFHDRVVRVRRERFATVLARAVAAGDLPPTTDIDLVTTLLVAPVLQQSMWRGCPAAGGDATSSERLVALVLAGARAVSPAVPATGW